MKNSRIVKLNPFSAGFLLMLLFVCISACKERSGSNDKGSRRAREKDTGTDSLMRSGEPGQSQTSIEAIQKAYADIVTKLVSGALDSTAFKYSCHNEKSGTVSYFTESGQLRLIVHRYNEYDHFSAVDRYFVKDSTLFFAYTSSVTWAFESGPEGATRDNITEKRVYLVNEQPIKCLEKKFVIRSRAADNPRAETVPSREVDCPSAEAVRKPYRLLTKFRSKPTSGCLD